MTTLAKLLTLVALSHASADCDGVSTCVTDETSLLQAKQVVKSGSARMNSKGVDAESQAKQVVKSGSARMNSKGVDAESLASPECEFEAPENNCHEVKSQFGDWSADYCKRFWYVSNGGHAKRCSRKMLRSMCGHSNIGLINRCSTDPRAGQAIQDATSIGGKEFREDNMYVLQDGKECLAVCGSGAEFGGCIDSCMARKQNEREHPEEGRKDRCCCTEPDTIDKHECAANGEAMKAKLGLSGGHIITTGYDSDKRLCCKTKRHGCAGSFTFIRRRKFKVEQSMDYCEALYFKETQIWKEKFVAETGAAAEKKAADEAAALAADRAKKAESRAAAEEAANTPALQAARDKDAKDAEAYFSARTAKKAANKEKRAADFVELDKKTAYAEAFANIRTREAASTSTETNQLFLENMFQALIRMKHLEELGILTKADCKEMGYKNQADLFDALAETSALYDRRSTKTMAAALKLDKLAEEHGPEVDALISSQEELEKAEEAKIASARAEWDAIAKVYEEAPDECILQAEKVTSGKECSSVQPLRNYPELKYYLEHYQEDLNSRLTQGFSTNYCKLFWYHGTTASFSDEARQCEYENGACYTPMFGGPKCKRQPIFQ